MTGVPPPADGHSSGRPSNGALLGGAALVGAAAGYAALAFRFRNFGKAGSTGSAEMRAAQAFSTECAEAKLDPTTDGLPLPP